MGRPAGVKNGQGKGSKGSSNKDFAPSSRMSIRTMRLDLNGLQNALTNSLPCTFCQHDMMDMPFIKIHIEHMVARENGGTNVPTNVVASCGPCNGSKSNVYTAIQFAFRKASETRDPHAHLAAIEASIKAQIETPYNAHVGTLIYAAWRYWSSELPYEDITTRMVVTKALEFQP